MTRCFNYILMSNVHVHKLISLWKWREVTLLTCLYKTDIHSYRGKKYLCSVNSGRAGNKMEQDWLEEARWRLCLWHPVAHSTAIFPQKNHDVPQFKLECVTNLLGGICITTCTEVSNWERLQWLYQPTDMQGERTPSPQGARRWKRKDESLKYWRQRSNGVAELQ